MQSGVIRVLVAVVRVIRYLWARDSKAWLLGELLGIILFFSPGFCGVGCLLRALSSTGGWQFASRYPSRSYRYRAIDLKLKD